MNQFDWTPEQLRLLAKGAALTEAAALNAAAKQLEAYLWRGIASAPKDGRYMLIAGCQFDDGVAVACWDDELGCWALDDGKHAGIRVRGNDPEFWMPLPLTPNT